MKAVLSIGIILLIILSACSTHKYSIDEMIVDDSALFKEFVDQNISISTRDSVRATYIFPTGKRKEIKKQLKEFSVFNYRFTQDSLFISDSSFRSSLAQNTISQIKFKGIRSVEVGFISEKEINERVPNGLGKIETGIIGAVAGGFVGVLLGGVIGSLIGIDINLYAGTTSIKKDNRSVGKIVGGLFGLTLGALICPNIFATDFPNLDSIIDEIKIKRMIRQDQKSN